MREYLCIAATCEEEPLLCKRHSECLTGAIRSKKDPGDFAGSVMAAACDSRTSPADSYICIRLRLPPREMRSLGR